MKKIVRGFAARFIRAIADRAAVDTEFQVAWPSDGSKHVVRIRSRVHCDENTKISRIAGVAWDSTERRQTELAFDKERSLLATLMDNLPYTFYFKDLDSRFVAVSRTLFRKPRQKGSYADDWLNRSRLVFQRTRGGRLGG